jgi:predicted AlkP superfamily pyrophosphatase or phosphodiesterase
VNRPRASRPVACILAAILGCVGAPWALAAPVLMISVDGMKPEYVLDAAAHDLRVPVLRGMVAAGSHAAGVVGVWPTITYPSHTTLVTGVSPAEHGILNNPEFDPLHRRQEPWYWYASEIRTTTLWQAVHAAHRVTASIGWPVTVGADIDFLIPEFWRIAGRPEELAPSDRLLIAALARPAGLIGALAPAAGPYMMANDTSLEGDAIKTRYAIEVLRRHRPAFMTVHLSSLDDAEHSFGPFSREADADMEALDGQIGALVAAARRANPATVVVVVSDHGFMPVPQRVNLAVPFVQAGLIDLEDGAPGRAPRIRDWRAQPWFAGGMAAIMLKDPQDAATSAQVGTLLRQLAAEPANGIAGVHSREQMRTLGGFPDAAYVVDFLPGYYAGSNTTGPLVTAGPPGHGGHGFSPELPEMRSAFFIAGPGIAAGRDLGIIDMRQIAPTVAGLLGVRLPDARAAALAVRREER